MKGNSTQPRRRFVIGKRLFALLVAYLLVTVGARLWWGWDAGRKLQAEIDAIRQRGEPATLREMKPPPVEGEDAFDLYKRAAEDPQFKKTMSMVAILKSDLATVAPSLLSSPGSAPATAQASAEDQEYVVMDEDSIRKAAPYRSKIGRELYDVLLDASFRRKHPMMGQQFVLGISESLSLIHVARGRATAHGFDYDAKDPFSNFVPPMMGSLNLARALRTAAVSAHEFGDDADAVEYLRGSLAMADSMEKVPTLITHMIGVSIRAMTILAVEDIAPTLRVGAHGADRQEVDALIRELTNLQLAQENLRNCLLGESNFVVAEEIRLASDPACGANWDETGDIIQYKLPGPVFWFVCKPSVLLQAREHIQFLKPHIAQARQLSYAPTGDYSEFIGDWGVLRKQAHWLNVATEPALKRVYVMHFRSIAGQQMAAVALAIWLYECEQGRRPATLAGLCPKYLSAVPADPFDPAGKEIRYLPGAKHPILYVIGQDRKDDHGRFEAKSKRSVNEEVLDIPFFLNGDREQACAEAVGGGKK